MMDPILFEIVARVAARAALASFVGVAIFTGVVAVVRALWRRWK